MENLFRITQLQHQYNKKSRLPKLHLFKNGVEWQKMQ